MKNNGGGGVLDFFRFAVQTPKQLRLNNVYYFSFSAPLQFYNYEKLFEASLKKKYLNFDLTFAGKLSMMLTFTFKSPDP